MPWNYHLSMQSDRVAAAFASYNRVLGKQQHHLRASGRRHRKGQERSLSCGSLEDEPQSSGSDEATKLLEAFQREQTIGSEYGEVKLVDREQD